MQKGCVFRSLFAFYYRAIASKEEFQKRQIREEKTVFPLVLEIISLLLQKKSHRRLFLGGLYSPHIIYSQQNTDTTYMEIIKKYFPNITATQEQQFAALNALYHDWNSKINVISRKDIDNLYEHHVLHSLAIAKALTFTEGTKILDFGCGGGFPGVPLAILFPKVSFRLIDGTGKKVRVAQEVADAIGLKNLEACHIRGEEEKGEYDFIVSRAVMPLPDLEKIVRKNISRKQKNAMPNGIFCLKGGNLDEELHKYRNIVEKTELSTFFDEEWFLEKYLIYLPM